jgi:hypothetical protein
MGLDRVLTPALIWVSTPAYETQVEQAFGVLLFETGKPPRPGIDHSDRGS